MRCKDGYQHQQKNDDRTDNRQAVSFESSVKLHPFCYLPL
jgi:hypothetical protein